MAASQSRSVIITCAITGSIHTPSMSPHLPVTPEEIADAALGAAKPAPRSSICTRAIRSTAIRHRIQNTSASLPPTSPAAATS
jgi:Uncharacterized conserved protein